MTDPKIRGYSVQQQSRFLDSAHFPSARRSELRATLPAEIRDPHASLDPASWYPRGYAVSLFRAMTSHASSADEAYSTMVACGEFIGAEATNTFLKILMRLMTPGLFAKKLPTFWERDMQGGRLEVGLEKVDDRRMTVRLVDVAGFDHIGPVTEGWVRFALRSIGNPVVEATQTGWSLETPGPHTFSLAVRW